MMKKIIIVGGGASGLTAAIASASYGNDVTILERMDRVGKKILATGNGRCNLTNINTAQSFYHGESPSFIDKALEKFGVEATIAFFEQLGIEYKVEEGGKVYPYSDQASSVLDVLRYECERLHVNTICDAFITKIQKKDAGFLISTKNGDTYYCDSVIVACGGKSSPNLGSNGSGYELLTSFGHKLIATFPALVQLKLNGSFFKVLKGVKFNGSAACIIDEKIIRKEYGELLFTDYGISGPPILQLSRIASKELINAGKCYLELDMFPNFSEEELLEKLRLRFSYSEDKSVDFSFVGLINKRLIPVILKEAGLSDIKLPCGFIKDWQIREICKILKSWQIEITGTNSWTEAQVTAGGIDTKDINPDTMESLLVSGLFVAGEILDIDGDCGGFNLQWAWCSGYIAGLYAAMK